MGHWGDRGNGRTCYDLEIESHVSLPLRGLGTLGGCVQRHIRSLAPSARRGLVTGESKLSSSIRGAWFASIVLIVAARFLVSRPGGEGREARAVAPEFAALGRACLVSGRSAILDDGMAVGLLSGPGSRWEELLATSVILEGWLVQTGVAPGIQKRYGGASR